MAAWSRGMILGSGPRGRGFDSRSGPRFSLFAFEDGGKKGGPKKWVQNLSCPKFAKSAEGPENIFGPGSSSNA